MNQTALKLIINNDINTDERALEVVANNTNRIEFIDNFLTMLKSPHTLRSYQTIIKEFFKVHNINEITIKMIQNIKFIDVQNYIINLDKQGKGTATIKQHIGCLRGFYNYAIDDNIVQHNYFAEDRVKRIMKLNLTTGDTFEGRALTTGEIEQLIKVTNVYLHKVMFSLMLRTGIRREETTKVCPCDFYYNVMEQKWYLEVHGKGHKERIVEVSQQTIDELNKIVEVGSESTEIIFDMTPGYINQLLDKYSKMAKLGKISPHDLRRTFATLLIEQGYSITMLQKVLGHKDIGTTQRYVQNINTYKQDLSNYVVW